MINKEEALKRVAVLETELAELKVIINKPDAPTFEQIVEELKPGWAVLSPEIASYCGYDRSVPLRHTSGESAFRWLRKRKWQLICEWVNKGKVIDWENQSQIKYIFYYNISSEEIMLAKRQNAKCEGAQCFLSDSDAHLALSIMGEESWLNMEGIK